MIALAITYFDPLLSVYSQWNSSESAISQYVHCACVTITPAPAAQRRIDYFVSKSTNQSCKHIWKKLHRTVSHSLKSDLSYNVHSLNLSSLDWFLSYSSLHENKWLQWLLRVIRNFLRHLFSVCWLSFIRGSTSTRNAVSFHPRYPLFGSDKLYVTHKLCAFTQVQDLNQIYLITMEANGASPVVQDAKRRPILCCLLNPCRFCRNM